MGHGFSSPRLTMPPALLAALPCLQTAPRQKKAPKPSTKRSAEVVAAPVKQVDAGPNQEKRAKRVSDAPQLGSSSP